MKKTIKAVCMNCGYRQTVEIEDNDSLKSVPCKNCKKTGNLMEKKPKNNQGR